MTIKPITLDDLRAEVRELDSSRRQAGKPSARTEPGIGLTGDALCDLPKTIAYMQGGVLTGVNFRQVLSGWQAIIKVTHIDLHKVAFINTETFAELLSVTADWAENGRFEWFTDRFPPK